MDNLDQNKTSWECVQIYPQIMWNRKSILSEIEINWNRKIICVQKSNLTFASTIYSQRDVPSEYVDIYKS